MRRSQRISLVLFLGAALLIAALVFTKSRRPTQGLAISATMRAFVSLKNRTAMPQQAEFDQRVTLAAMLQPGEDRARWSVWRAANVQGYVVDVREGGSELANCYSMRRRDTHVHLALRPDAPPREQVVLEITPRMQEWAERQGRDWSEATLRRELLGHWCYFEGWLFFDTEHAGESENTAAARPSNWRVTAWEIHPVTYLKIIR
jgi:hypothetical protein